MQVVSKNAQAPISETTPSPNAQSARERAISRLLGSNAPNGTSPPHTPQQTQPGASQDVIEAMAIPEANVGQETNTETTEATPAVTEPAKVEQPLSAQYAQLARKEKALRAQAQKLQADKAAFTAAQANAVRPALPSTSPQPESADAFRARLLKDPLNTLNEAGLTWDQLTQQALNQPSPSERAQQEYIAKLEARLESIEKGVKTTQESFQESQQSAYKQAVSQIRSEAKQLIMTDDAYETVRNTGSVEDVVELIERTFKEDNILLTVEEAAKEVESHIFEQALAVVNKTKKLQARLKSASSPVTQSQSPQATPKQPQQTMKTLTNAVGASRKLSNRDRAILAFKGELKE